MSLPPTPSPTVSSSYQFIMYQCMVSQHLPACTRVLLYPESLRTLVIRVVTQMILVCWPFGHCCTILHWFIERLCLLVHWPYSWEGRSSWGVELRLVGRVTSPSFPPVPSPCLPAGPAYTVTHRRNTDAKRTWPCVWLAGWIGRRRWSE